MGPSSSPRPAATQSCQKSLATGIFFGYQFQKIGNQSICQPGGFGPPLAWEELPEEELAHFGEGFYLRPGCILFLIEQLHGLNNLPEREAAPGGLFVGGGQVPAVVPRGDKGYHRAAEERLKSPTLPNGV